MALTTKQILTYLQLERIGRAKVFALAEYATDKELISDKDLLDYLTTAIESKIIKGVKKNGYDFEEITSASKTANYIIDKSQSYQIETISYYDKIYPHRLKNLIDEKGKNSSPLVLFCKGDLSCLDMPSIAIIGTREPTPEGIKAGTYFAKEFASNGFNIVSGLALGCDTSGHNGALEAKGHTTAFLSHGLDMIYPLENEKLAQQIIDNKGLLVSEYPIGTEPRANQFVERDRLQAGLADATLVIQTGLTGGTMHAVRSTLQSQKPLFCVQYREPTLLLEEKLQGNVKLIADGLAHPISSGSVAEAISIMEKNVIKHNTPQSLFD